MRRDGRDVSEGGYKGGVIAPFRRDVGCSYDLTTLNLEPNTFACKLKSSATDIAHMLDSISMSCLLFYFHFHDT